MLCCRMRYFFVFTHSIPMLDVQLNPFQTLHTARLVLRQITTNDAAALFAMRSDVNAMQYLDRPRAKSIEDAYKLIASIATAQENNDGITWAVTLKDDPRLIGTVGYYRLKKEHHRAEIGYMLHPAHWRKGIMTEACTCVLDFGFGILKFHSIEADINPNNTASITMIEKLGFKKEAHFVENYYYEGKFLDSVIYSKLAPK